MLLLSDSARLAGEPASAPVLLLPELVAAPATPGLLAPAEAPGDGLVELPVELAGLLDSDGGVVEPPAGAGGLPFFPGLPVEPTPLLPSHGPWPALSHEGGSGAILARKFPSG